MIKLLKKGMRWYFNQAKWMYEINSGYYIKFYG